MAYSALALQLVTQPTPTQGKYIEAKGVLFSGDVKGETVIRAILRKEPKAGDVADFLSKKQKGDHVIVDGELRIEQSGEGTNKTSTLVLIVNTICSSSPQQYVNTVVVVGPVSQQKKPTEKSCSGSIGSTRSIKQMDGNFQDVTSWFKTRGYGFLKEKVETAQKGDWYQAIGALHWMKSSQGSPYAEINLRKFRNLYIRRAGSSKQNPGVKIDAAGHNMMPHPDEEYETPIQQVSQQQQHPPSNPNMPSDWNSSTI